MRTAAVFDSALNSAERHRGQSRARARVYALLKARDFQRRAVYAIGEIYGSSTNCTTNRGAIFSGKNVRRSLHSGYYTRRMPLFRALRDCILRATDICDWYTLSHSRHIFHVRTFYRSNPPHLPLPGKYIFFNCNACLAGVFTVHAAHTRGVAYIQSCLIR